MELPKRVPQHISESASFKLFSQVIPNNWIVRDITEKDYGIDCYLEIVNDDNQLTGDLALIQLKSKDGIPWTKGNYYTLSNIKISTSNYWNQFAVPVFIFLTDIENNEVFYVAVKNYIKLNYTDYITQNSLSYKIPQNNKFDKLGISYFINVYNSERQRSQFENEMLFFLTNLERYKDFQADHSGRDFHLGVEDEDLVYFETMHHNYAFLCNYFSIYNPIPTVQDLKNTSKKRFEKNFYDLYELDLSELMDDFENITKEILEKISSLFENEKIYWLYNNTSLFNYVNNLKYKASN